MQLLSTPTSAYLLQASLEVLHYESREWQDEITFILDEVTFLHKLHRQFMEKPSPEIQRKHAIQLQETLRSFSAEVQKTRQEINTHEQYLAEILQNKSNVSDDAYRNKHKTVKLQVENLMKNFKQLKKEMFQWAEDVLS